jgi:hypothetical protein
MPLVGRVCKGRVSGTIATVLHLRSLNLPQVAYNDGTQWDQTSSAGMLLHTVRVGGERTTCAGTASTQG